MRAQFGMLIVVAAAAVAGAAQAADVGISISIGQPGFYGRIDLGNAPPPVLVNPRPILLAPAPPGVVNEPIYLRVPPGHQRNWRRWCAHYNACGRPVYFVQDDWYQRVYVPHWREEHARGHAERGRYEGHDGHDVREERDDHGHHDRGEDHDRGEHRGEDHDRD